MQDSEAGLVLQQCQIQQKDYNHCFTGLHFYFHFLAYIIDKTYWVRPRTELWPNVSSSVIL